LDQLFFITSRTAAAILSASGVIAASSGGLYGTGTCARVNRAIGRGLTAHVKVENLLDKQFEVARTRSGFADMGAPRWITAGIRAAW